ncbi:MAG: hypothetical protein GY861_04080 [bacterium]|nr:hypothetical protein [bacterium]
MPEKDKNKLERFRVELAKRTVRLDTRTSEENVRAMDNPQISKLGLEIDILIEHGKYQEARQKCEEALKKHPSEPILTNLQVVIEFLDKNKNNYNDAKRYSLQTLEHAIESNNTYYISVSLCNMGLIAHNEDHDEYSKMLYLTAHVIDMKAYAPIVNLAGWCSRRGKLEEAQKWIDKIIEIYPNWIEKERLVSIFSMDESLNNLRSYKIFKDEIMYKIEEKKKIQTENI